MKRIITVTLALAMVMSLCLPSLALEIPSEAIDLVELEQAKTFAYMDVSTVSAELKTKILEARETIIFSESWVADGISGRILDKDGNIKEELPQFSELFPADWNIPVLESSIGVKNEVGGVYGTSEGYVTLLYQGGVFLKKPSSTVNSPSFYSFQSTGFAGTMYEYSIETVYTWGIYQNPSEIASYNIGYSNADTGKSLGHATRLENGETFAIDPPRNITVAVRASTYDSVGSWSMNIHGLRVETF